VDPAQLDRPRAAVEEEVDGASVRREQRLVELGQRRQRSGGVVARRCSAAVRELGLGEQTEGK
jgi:hypothetical protein